MRRRPYSLALIGVAVSSLALAGCGPLSADSVTTEDREVAADVTGIVLSDAGRLTLSPGATASLSVTASPDQLERIRTESRDGVLHLEHEGRRVWFGRTGEITYDAQLPTVNSLRVQGSGDIDATVDPADTLEVTIDGSGHIRIEGVQAGNLTVKVSGSGDVELVGTADRLSLEIDGSGDIDGTELVSSDATATIRGSGNINVNATNTLDARISGAGSISHSGGATVTKTVNGAGVISGS